ncbi:MAG: NAD-dependent epimerase/dehydratase family protein [Nitrospiraceae bacterium]
MNLTKIDGHPHVIITGGAGFIGSHLSARFLSAGARVTILTRHVDAPQAVQLAKQGASVLPCDFSTPDGLPDLSTIPSAGIICHLAADVSVSGPRLWAANVDGTRRALELASTLNVPYFVYASSIEAQGLGSPQEIPLHEGRPCRPVSDYGASKAHAEELVMNWSQSAAQHALILRIGNIYGPGSAWLLQPTLMSLLGHGPLHRVWDQLRHRLFQPLYIDDLTEGMIQAIRKRLTGIYNITGEEPVSVGVYFQKVARLLRLEDELARIPSAPPNLPSATGSVAADFAYLLMGSPEHCHRSYDNSKLRAQIGPYTSWSLLRGLAATVSWYHASGSLTALCRAVR